MKSHGISHEKCETRYGSPGLGCYNGLVKLVGLLPTVVDLFATACYTHREPFPRLCDSFQPKEYIYE